MGCRCVSSSAPVVSLDEFFDRAARLNERAEERARVQQWGEDRERSRVMAD